MDIFHRVNRIKSLAQELEGDLEGVLDELEQEEIDSKDEVDNWDEEGDEPEPVLIDNSVEIDKIKEQLETLGGILADLESLL
jgi:replicative DNA helicase